jgi:hypothetical protein
MSLQVKAETKETKMNATSCKCSTKRNGNQLTGTIAGVNYGPAAHVIDPTGEYCRTCGSDACTCQGCGRRVCGSQTEWIEGIGNVVTK